eukprot:scaffold112259_cov59-Phaeocystis_antarctica.AAC.1
MTSPSSSSSGHAGVSHRTQRAAASYSAATLSLVAPLKKATLSSGVARSPGPRSSSDVPPEREPRGGEISRTPTRPYTISSPGTSTKSTPLSAIATVIRPAPPRGGSVTSTPPLSGSNLPATSTRWPSSMSSTGGCSLPSPAASPSASTTASTASSPASAAGAPSSAAGSSSAAAGSSSPVGAASSGSGSDSGSGSGSGASAVRRSVSSDEAKKVRGARGLHARDVGHGVELEPLGGGRRALSIEGELHLHVEDTSLTQLRHLLRWGQGGGEG